LTTLRRLPYSVGMTNGEVIFKSRTEQRIEAEQGGDIADILRRLYHERGLSQAEMGLLLGVHRTTVVELMQRHHVETAYNKSTSAA
jgi:hypothetical protein